MAVIPTTLYRYFDRDGHLLYVGITGVGLGRMHGHSNSKAKWWRKVHHATFRHYVSREAAHRAEIEAIRTERPRFNIDHRVWGPRYLPDVLARLAALPPAAKAMPTTELADILAIPNIAVRRACRADVFRWFSIGRVYFVRIDEYLETDVRWFVNSDVAYKFL